MSSSTQQGTATAQRYALFTVFLQSRASSPDVRCKSYGSSRTSVSTIVAVILRDGPDSGRTRSVYSTAVSLLAGLRVDRPGV